MRCSADGAVLEIILNVRDCSGWINVFFRGPPESSEDEASGDEGLPDDDNSDVSTAVSFQYCTWIFFFFFSTVD